ncbi:butyrophilin-like protein 8 isoform X2 [Perca flavescens]|uniref:butyrophilin-like protein 8 isoform X2 n=1 Tax=Perca flavescens TaxID=8167 RepID=UPI00106E1884|nr:butyrophilin-like protein 8 isoform X2 [Perca flavescens]
MICSILLLIILTSCVSGTLVVNVTQTSYQAEENHHITLEWTFTTNPHTSSNSLNIFCELLTDLRPSVLFYLHDGVEVPESQDEQFAGRIQWDKDVLREGRIRLHVSRLRTEDSGLYKCYVDTDYGRNSGRFWLNVTAADEPKTSETNSETRTRESGKHLDPLRWTGSSSRGSSTDSLSLCKIY